jgi:hypothetical protein
MTQRAQHKVARERSLRMRLTNDRHCRFKVPVDVPVTQGPAASILSWHLEYGTDMSCAGRMFDNLRRPFPPGPALFSLWDKLLEL